MSDELGEAGPWAIWIGAAGVVYLFGPIALAIIVAVVVIACWFNSPKPRQ